jgi:hypothetical protein
MSPDAETSLGAARKSRVRAPRGVFMTFGGPAGPWKLPDGRGSAAPPSRERKVTGPDILPETARIGPAGMS